MAVLSSPSLSKTWQHMLLPTQDWLMALLLVLRRKSNGALLSMLPVANCLPVSDRAVAQHCAEDVGLCG